MSQLPESYVTRFARRLRESFEGEASDLTIICGEREWKVHKLVLCLNSDVFKKMLQGEFKVSDNHSLDLCGYCGVESSSHSSQEIGPRFRESFQIKRHD